MICAKLDYSKENRKTKSTNTVLDILVLVKLEVSINDSLVFDNFNANKFLSVGSFKRSSYTETTSNLAERASEGQRRLEVNGKSLEITEAD